MAKQMRVPAHWAQAQMQALQRDGDWLRRLLLRENLWQLRDPRAARRIRMNLGTIGAITCNYVTDDGSSLGNCNGNSPTNATGVEVTVVMPGFARTELASGVLDRVTAIFEAFDDDDSGLGVSELALRSGLPKSTVSRLVADLVRQRYLERDGTYVNLEGRIQRVRLHPLVERLDQLGGGFRDVPAFEVVVDLVVADADHVDEAVEPEQAAGPRPAEVHGEGG